MMDLTSVFTILCRVIIGLFLLVPALKLAVYAVKLSRARREQARKEREQEAELLEKRRIAAAKKAEQQRKADERAAAAREKRLEKERQQAQRLEAARQMAEYAQQALQAERELQALRAKSITAPLEPAPQPKQTPVPKARPAFVGNNAFAHEYVAFTGTLPGMMRAEAMQAVAANGGRASEDMPACTTLLVVGDKPGENKLHKADQWGVKKIDAETFWARVHQPLTLTPDEFAALIGA